jgi:hypothetical protein
LRFSLVARETIVFPAGKPENILRGAFGTIFRKLACVPECTDARRCEVREACAYARMFEPAGNGPSGFANRPRPFVFRAKELDGRTVRKGEEFGFDVNLFEMRSPAVNYFVRSFKELAVEGLGPGRGKAELRGVRGQTGGPLALRLDWDGEPVDRVRVRFLTPTELKAGQRVVERPEFGVLAARTRDRVSKLRELYDTGPLEMDFKGFGERAERVRLVKWAGNKVEASRRSSRTGHVHPIGGFVGEAEYEGELGEFVPWLRVAKWTGVGRQTVWGKGEVELL